MPAALIVQLIAQLGIPLAAKVFTIVTRHFDAGTGPSEAMWNELIDAENKSHAKFVEGLNIPPT